MWRTPFETFAFASGNTIQCYRCNVKVAGFRKTFWVLTLLLLLVSLAWLFSNREEISEAFHEATCRAPCPALSTEQLRLQVIKTVLHNQLDSSIESQGAGGYMQIALLPRDFTKEDIKQEVTSESLVRTLTTNATLFRTHAQIDALTIDTFANHPSIAFYSFLRREAQIIPTRSVQATTLSDIEEYGSNSETQPGKFHRPPFTWWEKQRGYGQLFFGVTTYSFLSLACCDGLGDHQGLTPYWFKKNNMKNINYAGRTFIIVSNRGAILNRYHDE